MRTQDRIARALGHLVAYAIVGGLLALIFLILALSVLTVWRAL